jgi:aminopeptidase N
MKRIFILSSLLFCTIMPKAQRDYCKSREEIVLAEQRAHQRLENGTGQSFASNNFHVSYYRCEWNIDPSKFYISGKVTSYFRMTASGSTIVFDLSATLMVEDVTMRQQTLSFSRTGNTVSINLPTTYNAGKRDSLTISYKGEPGNTGFGSFITSTHAGKPVMWTLSEPYGSRDWWPCRNGLDDKADSIDIIVKHPVQYTLSSNGTLAGRTESGKVATTRYQHRYPIASYLVAIAVTNYVSFSKEIKLKSGQLTLFNHVYPENLNSFQNDNIYVENAMRLFDSVWAPYPFRNERYGVTQFGWGGGMEHQTNSFVTSPSEGLAAHELAHQWFGDKITTGSWTDIWLNEGFATYNADYLYNELYHPEQVIPNAESDRQFITIVNGGSVIVDDTANVSRIFDGRLSYSKGAFVLRTLRHTIGDKNFFTGIRRYIKDRSLVYGFARTPDLQAHLEEVSGLDLDYFFSQWIYGQGYPKFDVKWSQTGSGSVTVTVNQTTSHPSVSFFKVKLPVLLKSGSQEKLFEVDIQSNGQSFSLNPGFAATSMELDPDVYLLSKGNKITRLTTNNIIDFTISPNPFTDRLQISVNENAGKKLQFTLSDATGRIWLQQIIVCKGGEQQIEVLLPNALPIGLYQCSLRGDNGIATQHVYKQ